MESIDVKEKTSRDVVILALLSVCALLIAFNIVLLNQSYFQKKALQKEKQKQADQIAEMQKAGLAQIADWQAELSAWTDIEQSIESMLQKDHEKSLLFLTNAIQKYNQNPLFYYLRALSNEFLGKEEDAIQDFTIYLAHATSSAHGLWKRAFLYYKQKKWVLAIEDLEKLLVIAPDHKDAQKLLQKIRETDQ